MKIMCDFSFVIQFLFLCSIAFCYVNLFGLFAGGWGAFGCSLCSYLEIGRFERVNADLRKQLSNSNHCQLLLPFPVPEAISYHFIPILMHEMHDFPFTSFVIAIAIHIVSCVCVCSFVFVFVRISLISIHKNALTECQKLNSESRSESQNCQSSGSLCSL